MGINKSKTMKFTELNMDCLEEVLEYLELIDLLNVADSTKRLKKAAELVYGRRYGGKILMFDHIKISPDQSFRVTDKELQMEGLKISLQLLRCVGRVVSKIKFSYVDIMKKDVEYQSQIDRKIYAYINNYCAEYLEKIDIKPTQLDDDEDQLYRNDIMEYFEKPFTNLVKLSIYDYKFTEKTCIDRLFPKLRQLCCKYLEDVSFYRFNKKYFPYLEKLQIYELGSSFCQDEILPFLQLNPQLRELLIFSEYSNPDLIRSAVDSLQNIEWFELDVCPITSIEDSDNFIHMKSVKIFEIRFGSCCLEMPRYFLPYSFKQLEKFSICYPEKEYRSSFKEEFFDFIAIHSRITHLQIRQLYSFLSVDLSRLAKYLPLLVELILPDMYLWADEAIELMAKFQMLKHFRFRLFDEYESFRKRLGSKWQTIGQKTLCPGKTFVQLKRII